MAVDLFTIETLQAMQNDVERIRVARLVACDNSTPGLRALVTRDKIDFYKGRSYGAKHLGTFPEMSIAAAREACR